MVEGRRAVVTGASAGIGEATAKALASSGHRVVVGARRLERLESIAAEIGAQAFELDVTDEESVDRFAAAVGPVDVVINNAGLSQGMDHVVASETGSWQRMFETNVIGAMRIARAFIPRLIESGDGHLVQLGSISGFEVYPGGAGYTASKHAMRAMTKTLRLELLGEAVRVTDICPGMVETEFSTVRFDGDADRAAQIYSGLQPLVAEDIADCILWAVTRPSNVNIDEIVVRPRAQATSTAVHRAG